MAGRRGAGSQEKISKGLVLSHHRIMISTLPVVLYTIDGKRL